ncbi:hypothetical protein AGABI1DRAFT_131686 [Agaricus bisporus var. burnettii JB137-S8]|uniref:Uncharacterized protein n=1 Tax=Agaricus bisporus var. burnettii (strain JB137-S8 / ATCC MYA-4627 / FGSC 10392) TaxID=597362 RepID=K5WKY0_AGABU|nr:uncharacterized protein AGABI1DRAFT_131686 [Agaricus bisporus var. burnettii JB137-S8]EKM75966.1 hypothetical protein AGABI1DRAFT_131686 [Agaricus bisporus var. burnettii JB137-S8]
MGKSKSKKSQPKRYPTPSDKYLIVTDPWGGIPVSEPNFFNNVTAWFEIMFRPKYPGLRPSAIFYQWTNKNIIVEIPDQIDVEPYLGAHYWSTFLVPPHCYNVGTRASFIYEFETRFFPIPVNQGGWIPGYAQYNKVRDKFDVKEPYPDPLPAPNSTLPFAKRLPLHKVVAANQPAILSLLEPSLPKELNNEKQMSPPPLPVSTKPKLSSKIDPYEEEEAAEASLRDPSINSPIALHPSKTEPMHHRIKEEILPYDQDDLDDDKLRVKAEELDEDEGGEYRPSDELTKAFASLQQEQPEEEGEEQNQPSSSNYVPSEDLLAALSSLPEGMVEINSSSSSSLVPPKIKAEPQDDDVLPLSRLRANLSERNIRDRSMTLTEDDTASTVTKRHNDIRVKREWSDEAYDGFRGTAKRVKLEQ